MTQAFKQNISCKEKLKVKFYMFSYKQGQG